MLLLWFWGVVPWLGLEPGPQLHGPAHLRPGPDLCALLLDQGARADAQEHESWTPLRLATQNNLENVAQLLVSRQADLNLQEAEGKAPLRVAAYFFGHVSLVQLLTGRGTELDPQQRHLAAEQGKVRAGQHLLKSGAAPGALGWNGYSPLHTAAARGRYLTCQVLLRYGASLELPTQQGWTALHLAVYRRRLESIQLRQRARQT